MSEETQTTDNGINIKISVFGPTQYELTISGPASSNTFFEESLVAAKGRIATELDDPAKYLGVTDAAAEDEKSDETSTNDDLSSDKPDSGFRPTSGQHL